MKIRKSELKGLVNSYNNFRKTIKKYVEDENVYFSLISIDSITEKDNQLVVDVYIY